MTHGNHDEYWILELMLRLQYTETWPQRFASITALSNTLVWLQFYFITISIARVL